MLKTEMRNPKSTHIDKMSTIDMVNLIAEENILAVKAVQNAAESIAKAVEEVTKSFKNGGRLFYIGAGTSGRLGVLDASECPPTFGVDYDMVTGIIAGGRDSMFRASENKEDIEDAGIQDIVDSGFKKGDVLVGISAAGGAAYVIGALKKAKELGGVCIALTCNEDTKIEKVSDVCIITDTGAEVVTGSTRMKAGTAHKVVLNILTTCGMIQIGNVYENLMINLKPTNIKLRARMIRIVTDICGCDEVKSEELLEKGDWNIRCAVELYKN